MRRVIIITLIIFTLVCVGWWVIDLTLLHKKVTFVLAGNNYTLQIRNTSGKTLKNIDSTQDITLRAGDYLYNTVGTDYDGRSIPFSITGDIEIKIQPEYTESYLTELTNKEKQNALDLINARYSTVGRIVITDFSLSKDAQWGYGKLTLNNRETDIYRFILKKDKENWKVHMSPRIIISKNDAKDIPKEILYSLY